MSFLRMNVILIHMSATDKKKGCDNITRSTFSAFWFSRLVHLHNGANGDGLRGGGQLYPSYSRSHVPMYYSMICYSYNIHL